MTQSKQSLPCARGAYTDLGELVRLRAPAARLKLSPPAAALAQLAGPLRSNFRGRGIEFEEVRKYAAGDDVRNIDWRVTARTGEVFTKQFREERERPVFIMVDQRPAMFFGSRNTLKSVQAVHVASLLAWATIEAGDRLGGLVLGQHEHHEVRPRRSRHAVMELLRLMHTFNHELGTSSTSVEQTPLSNALVSLRRVLRPGALLFVISDFADWDDECVRQLRLLSRHTEINAIRIGDPLERALPGIGRAAVSDGNQRRELETGDARLRQRYSEAAETIESSLRDCLSRSGVPMIRIDTVDSALGILMRYFRGGRR